MNIRQYIELVGRDTFVVNGFTQQTISNFINEGSFPSAHYLRIKAIADAENIKTPIHLFRWTEFSPSAGYQTSHEQEIKSL